MATAELTVCSLMCYTIIAVDCRTCVRIFGALFEVQVQFVGLVIPAQPDAPISTARGGRHIISVTKKTIYARVELIPVRLF